MSQRQRRPRDQRRQAERRGPSGRQIASGATIAVGATVAATGSAHAADFTTKTRSVTGVATLKLPVIAKGKKRHALDRSGKAKIKAKVTYNAIGNAANTLKKKLKLLKR